ncbi:MAG TPA: ATP-binding protein [Candidatus Limnocylindria bacterium]|nr:ATP-binding protein [Candidatus Limnocylindria bacterium]
MRRALGGTRARLALVSTVVLALALTLADVALLTTLAYAQRADTDRLLAAQAEVVAAGIEDTNGVISLGADAPGQSAEGIAVDSAVVSGGFVVAESPGQSLPKAMLLAVADEALRTGRAPADGADTHGIPHRVYAKALDAGRVLVVSRSVAELNANLQRTAGLLTLASLGLVAVAGAVSYWMAGRALRGVRDNFESLRRFTADASHELRAPLALLGNELDVTLQRERSVAEYQQSLTGMRTEVDHLARLTDHLLLLARADARALIAAREPIDVADALHEAAARWSRAASQAGVTVAVIAPDSGTLRAEPPLLRRVIDNLVDNALRHSPAGGTVTLSGTRGDGGWWIAVRDQGPGVAEEHRSRLFTRFARPDAARTRDAGGAGLGLALSAAIVSAHGGRLELAAARPGATFRFFLPDA